ncbi:hypothetical protein A9K55_008439 [Cordyceps militaris]|uniref:Uncharacterized protein n=1 Tax=Cordyceps militaris TaxID=73501 RepID=A0A2H4SJ86_CORMI|nr:hypothetical protein A9K55_008439 [Cordyceps militaris]
MLEKEAPSAAATLKAEEPEAAADAAPGRASTKPRAKQTAAAPSRSRKPAAKNRVAKPARARPKTFSRKMSLIAEAESETAAFAADGDGLVWTAPMPDGRIPAPRPSEDVFPRLPDDANPIDRATFERLALVWAEEAGRWTEDMQRSLLHNLPRARVTKSTATFSNHYISRTVRVSGVVPTWGQFLALRVMFGPAVCFREQWAVEFARRYPLALEDAYDGVVPDTAHEVRNILDGKIGMPVVSRRKITIRELAKDRKRTRKRRPAAAAASQSQAAPGKKDDDWAEEEEAEVVRMVAGRQPPKKDEVDEVAEDAWNEAAASAASMDPNTVIAKLRKRYCDQMAQIQRLRKDNDEIRKSLDAFNNMAAKVKDE